MVEERRKRGQTNHLEVGALAETLVLRYLERTGQRPQDVRDDRQYRRRDIDFILNDGQTVEVKGDTWLHKTGNLFFELTRDHGLAGCFFRSKADLWYYVDVETGETLQFRLSEAQAWLVRNLDKVHITSARAHRRGGFVDFVGAKVPKDAFLTGVRCERMVLS